MRQTIASYFLLFGFISLFFVGAAHAENTIKLDKAAVYANDTLEGGKLAPVMLLSYDGKDYYLSPNAESAKLEKLIEHTVNVQGDLTKDAKGRNVLTITSFKEAFN